MLDAIYAEDQSGGEYGLDHVPAVVLDETTTYYVLPARKGVFTKYDSTVAVILREDGLLRDSHGDGIHTYDALLDGEPAYDLYSYDQNTLLGTVLAKYVDQLPVTRRLDARCW